MKTDFSINHFCKRLIIKKYFLLINFPAIIPKSFLLKYQVLKAQTAFNESILSQITCCLKALWGIKDTKMFLLSIELWGMYPSNFSQVNSVTTSCTSFYMVESLNHLPFIGSCSFIFNWWSKQAFGSHRNWILSTTCRNSFSINLRGEARNITV